MKASTHVSTRSTKHVNIQAHEQNNLKVHIPKIFQSSQHLSKIVKAFERTNVQLHDNLSLQAYTNISIQECAHVCGNHTSEYICLYENNYQSI